MKTKNEIVAELKKAHPSLRLGSEEEGYTELEAAEYQAQINEWADSQLASEQAKADAEAKKATAQAKLAALGLDADDLKALGL